MNRTNGIMKAGERGASGQATLSLVFLVGGLVILIGVTLSVLVISLINSGYGFQAANKALAIAQGGVSDAYLQLARNKDFSSPTGYSVPLDTYTASVTVTQNSPSPGLVTIVASSTVIRFTRKIQSVVSVSTSTGQLHVLTWDQLTL